MTAIETVKRPINIRTNIVSPIKWINGWLAVILFEYYKYQSVSCRAKATGQVMAWPLW